MNSTVHVCEHCIDVFLALALEVSLDFRKAVVTEALSSKIPRGVLEEKAVQSLASAQDWKFEPSQLHGRGTNSEGETDLLITWRSGGLRYDLHVENKIHSRLRKNQLERYAMAVAAKAPQAFVALLAPEKYLNSCSREIVVESGKPSIPIHQLKYETLFGRDGRYGMFPYHEFPQPMRERLQRLFASAIEKAKNAQVEDPEATLFVKSYAEIMAKANVFVCSPDIPRGQGQWINLRVDGLSALPSFSIQSVIHKTEKHWLDVHLRPCAGYSAADVGPIIEELRKEAAGKLDIKESAEPTSGSWAIRLVTDEVPYPRPTKPLEVQEWESKIAKVAGRVAQFLACLKSVLDRRSRG